MFLKKPVVITVSLKSVLNDKLAKTSKTNLIKDLLFRLPSGAQQNQKNNS